MVLIPLQLNIATPPVPTDRPVTEGGVAYPYCVATLTSPVSNPAIRGSRHMIHQATVNEDEPITLLGRFMTADKYAVLEAAVASITVKATNIATNTTRTISADLDDVWYDTLQTDALWAVDSDGYNFKLEVNQPTFLPNGGEKWRYEVSVYLDAGGAPLRKAWEIRALAFIS